MDRDVVKCSFFVSFPFVHSVIQSVSESQRGKIRLDGDTIWYVDDDSV